MRFLIFPDYVIPGRKRGEETRRGDPSMSLPFSEFKLLSTILKKKIDKDFFGRFLKFHSFCVVKYFEQN